MPDNNDVDLWEILDKEVEKLRLENERLDKEVEKLRLENERERNDFKEEKKRDRPWFAYPPLNYTESSSPSTHRSHSATIPPTFQDSDSAAPRLNEEAEELRLENMRKLDESGLPTNQE